MNMDVAVRFPGKEGERTAAEVGLRISFEEIPGGTRVRFAAKEDFRGLITLSLPLEKEQKKFFLPGFMYGTNRGEDDLYGDSLCPRLGKEERFPVMPAWRVRADRLSHPCAFAYGNGHFTGLSASPYFVKKDGKLLPWTPGTEGELYCYAGFGCDLGNGRLLYTLGYENAPWFFLQSHHYFPAEPLKKEQCFCLRAGQEVMADLLLYDACSPDERGLEPLLRDVYARFHQSPRLVSCPERTVREIAGAVKRDAWLKQEHNYAGFVFDRGDRFEYRVLPSITWTNGLSAAVPMLACALRLQDEEMRAQALDCIGFIVSGSLNTCSGLPYASCDAGVWTNRGWWHEHLTEMGHTGYITGQAVFLILKAYALEKEQKGVCHEDWLRFAKGVIAVCEKNKNEQGEYPYLFSEKDASGVEYDSVSGAWCLAAAAMYTYLSGDRQYLPGLTRSEAHYMDTYVKHMCCWGGPMDIDKEIDSEGILPLIRAAALLHRLTGEEKYLDDLRDALEYEFTFKFCYNSPIQVPPLSERKWSSCGGSITSVSNPHIHPMSSSVADEMFYYLSCREDRYIRERLRDTLIWSTQCHNTYDREFGYGKTGWMSERFCHSQGLLTEKYPDGSPASTWFALMPWACGSLLEALSGKAWDEWTRIV